MADAEQQFGPCIGGGSSRDCERGECNALATCAAMGEYTSARLARVELERDEAVRRCADLEQVREELRQLKLQHEGCIDDAQHWDSEKVDLIDAKLALKAELASARKDLDLLRAQLADAKHEECAFKALAERAVFERDEARESAALTRAQLDEVLAEFSHLRDEKEETRA